MMMRRRGVRSQGNPSINNKISHEEWEMINPDYVYPMLSPSPSECSVSLGRFSKVSPEAFAMSPWTLLPTLPFNYADAPPPSFRCVTSMLKPGGQIYSIAVAADGFLYTGSDSKPITVWRHPDFPPQYCLKSGSGNVKALLVAGDRIFSAHGDNKIRLWQRSRPNNKFHTRVATLPDLNTFPNLIRPLISDHGTDIVKHMGIVTCLAYNANDDLLYTGSCDKSVTVWKVSEPTRAVETIEAHTEAVNAIIVRSDGILFSGSDDRTVKVWRRRPGRGQPKHELMMTLSNQRSAVKALALGPYWLPVVYAGCYDGYIHYWEENRFSDRIFNYAGLLRGHLRPVICLQTVGDLLLSGSADTTIRVWKREAGGTGICCIAVMEGHIGPVKCIAAAMSFNANSFIAYSGSLDGSVKVWMGRIKTTMVSRLTSPPRIR